MNRLRAGVAVVLLAIPSALSAQTRVSLGAGAGIAGSTDASLSEGQTAPVVMGQITRSVMPLVRLGAEVDVWLHAGSYVTVATGIVQVHLPSTGFFLKAGVGYGAGDPDGRGRAGGVAGQIGAGYDITIPGAPVGFTLFANASLAYGSLRSLQMVDGGLALTLW
jgi:hypothetical protein